MYFRSEKNIKIAKRTGVVSVVTELIGDVGAIHPECVQSPSMVRILRWLSMQTQEKQSLNSTSETDIITA